MASFSELILTDSGKELCTKTLLSSEKIEFTKIKASGNKYNRDDLSGLECLEDIRQVEEIRTLTRDGNYIQLDTVFSNKSLDEGYTLNTIGLYARLAEEDEVLFAVSVEIANGVSIPKMITTVTDIQLRLKIYMENVENVRVVMNTGAMATVADILEVRKQVENTADTVYQQSTGYTNIKIAELINGAPSTLDTLGEIAQAMQDNESVVDALDDAIGSKASQAELDGHINNDTIHITASERAEYQSMINKLGGCWISFTDADGNPTDIPYIHWYADDGTEVTN